MSTPAVPPQGHRGDAITLTKPRTYLSALSWAGTLGQAPEEILAALFAGEAPGLIAQTGWREGGEPVVVGRLRHEPPPLAEAWASLASRNNALLAAVFEPLREAVAQTVARFGAGRVGVILGTSTSGIAEGEAALAALRQNDAWPAGYHYTRQELGAAAEFLARFAGLCGPAYTISTACTSSGKALIAARRLIQVGLADAVVCGGADTLCKLTVRGFAALEATSAGFSSPFTAARDGINLGEGAALFLLTREPAAIELLGAGESSDAHHISAPDPEGLGAEIALRAALADAKLAPRDIAYVNLHGTGTPLNDAMEAKLMARVFGEGGVPASSTKPLTGHPLGAAAAMELGICWLLLSGYNAGRRVPGQVWRGAPDESLPRLAFTTDASELPQSKQRALMSNSFAFGGSNVSLIIGDAGAVSAPAGPPQGRASQAPERAKPANRTHPLPEEGGRGEGSIRPAGPPQGRASQAPERAQPANRAHPLPEEGGRGDGSIRPAGPPQGRASQTPERAQPANRTHPLPPEGGRGEGSP